MPFINCRKISKFFNTLHVLNNINLEVKEGEFTVIFGPNGSGKSTLLNIIAGLEKPSGGSVFVNNK